MLLVHTLLTSHVIHGILVGHVLVGRRVGGSLVDVVLIGCVILLLPCVVRLVHLIQVALVAAVSGVGAWLNCKTQIIGIYGQAQWIELFHFTGLSSSYNIIVLCKVYNLP